MAILFWTAGKILENVRGGNHEEGKQVEGAVE